MIQLTPHMKILLAIEPVDFRNGIDGLAAICRKVMKSDPFSGYVFVFCNRHRTAIKILTYDGFGFWLLQKRLSQGRFNWWPKDNDAGISEIASHELQILIWNGDPSACGIGPEWRKILK